MHQGDDGLGGAVLDHRLGAKSRHGIPPESDLGFEGWVVKQGGVHGVVVECGIRDFEIYQD